MVKDNYGTIKKVHIKDVKPIEMDIATAEFFRKEREQCTTRDAKHVMPVKQIPDLQWELIENIDLMETTVYCIQGVEGETEATEASEAAEDTEAPKNTEDIEATEVLEPVTDSETTAVCL